MIVDWVWVVGVWASVCEDARLSTLTAFGKGEVTRWVSGVIADVILFEYDSTAPADVDSCLPMVEHATGSSGLSSSDFIASSAKVAHE